MLWKRIKRWVMELLGIEPSAVKLGDRVFAPLAYVSPTDGMAMTWDYLNKSKSDQKYCREMILNMAQKDETPAIVFLLSPGYEAGSAFDHFPNINEANLAIVVEAIRECAWDGIAALGCWFTDDKPANPVTREGWFYQIENYQGVLQYVHARIGRYISGYCLSIESNEQCKTVSALQHYIHLMKKYMGNKPCGTHLQWQSKGADGYVWNSDASTPQNADFILAEFSWHPNQGDKHGVEGIDREQPLIQAACGKNIKLLYHEYNLNPIGKLMTAQRKKLRKTGAWGVG